MSLQLYNKWQKDGSPYRLCRPGVDMSATLHVGHGFILQWYPDRSHLIATPAEDHTPYSQTGWPGISPYGVGMAIDIVGGGDLITLGTKIVADKNANVPGTEPIKYVNWTDATGKTWHDSWQPNHEQRPSSDVGHIHISYCTNFADTPTAYDPFNTQQKRRDMANFLHVPNPVADSQYMTDPAFQQVWAFDNNDIFQKVYAAAGSPPSVAVSGADLAHGVYGQYMGTYTIPRVAPSSGEDANHKHSTPAGITGPAVPLSDED